jgi:UDP-N-acetylmuramoyl-tripeptide--D-alanyl-D-alanine ligase
MPAPAALARLYDRIDAVVLRWILQLRRAQARAKQRQLVSHYVAVTGSCGKTTTSKLASVLLGCYGTASLGLNNAGTKLLRDMRHLRVPVDYWVQETSGHQPGAIAESTSVYRIDTAVVTSVGYDHATNYRNADVDIPDAIAREKGKLVEAVAPGGFACLNFDDPRVRAMASRTRERVISFGTSPDAEVRAENVRCAWPGRLCFDLVVAGKTYPVTTQFVGTMALTNLLAALAVVYGHGLPLEPAIARLALEQPVRDRMGIHAGRDGKTYILDTEKAPKWSVDLLVQDLPRMAIPSLTFVLGDLSDVRGGSGAQYRKLVRSLAAEVETLVLVGFAAEYAGRLANSDVGNLVVAPTAFDVANYLDTQPPGVVFLKANSTSQLWRVLDQVTSATGQPATTNAAE